MNIAGKGIFIRIRRIVGVKIGIKKALDVTAETVSKAFLLIFCFQYLNYLQ
jgi:hypothetical protein